MQFANKKKINLKLKLKLRNEITKRGEKKLN